MSQIINRTRKYLINMGYTQISFQVDYLKPSIFSSHHRLVFYYSPVLENMNFKSQEEAQKVMKEIDDEMKKIQDILNN